MNIFKFIFYNEKLEQFPDEDFKYFILVITFANFIISYAVETVVVPCISNKWKSYENRKLMNKIKNSNKNFTLSQLEKIRRI